VSIAVGADNRGCSREIVVGLGGTAEPAVLWDGLAVIFPSRLLRTTHRLNSVPVLPYVGAGLNALTRCQVPAFAAPIRMSRDRAHDEKDSSGKRVIV